MVSSQKICILGGGFGGLYAALRLAQLPAANTDNLDIVLVDRAAHFVFSPLLYELITGELQSWEIAPPFVELLENTSVRFRQAGVDSIDIEARSVRLDDGGILEYDRLVLALGGETPMNMVPGAAEFAIPFKTIDDAYRLQEQLRRLEAADPEKIRVAIVGAGYSGVELACKLADRLGEKGRVRLVERDKDILATASEFNRQAARQALSDRGVWLDLETTVTALTADTISLEYREKIDTIPVDIVLWTVGMRVAKAVRSLPLEKTDRGQLKMTPTLQAIDRSEIFVLGDLANCLDADGKQVPNTAQAAIQQADYAAWNVWASLRDRPLLPFRYQNLGEMMALGTDSATLTGLGIKLDGPLAYAARRLTYLYRLPTLEHRIKVGLNWMVSPVAQWLKEG